ncbi:MAG: DNA photolyase [Acidobacteria bacterium]|nr:DNA photolyase [Acidobacteriota bacterium]
MIPYAPERILVQEESWQDSVTLEILERLPGVEVRTVKSREVRFPEPSQGSPAPWEDKNTLFLLRHPGSFLKRCQGSGADTCCNYYVLSCTWNCHLDCSYCVLQSYLGGRALVVGTNFQDLMREVREKLGSSPHRIFRIGTGELADSLALDPATGFSRRLVPFFARLSNGFLELKTKSDCVANLEGLDHGGHTVVSWSVNSKRICRTEEEKAPTLEERLAAALQCQKWGYRLGFHFDPLIYYDGWEDDYREAVGEIFRSINPERVAWLSLGALRFPPHLIGHVKKRFPESKIPYGEFVPGHHGKMRYFRPIREAMYRKMISWIREAAPGLTVYLCMESFAVWEGSFRIQYPGPSFTPDRLDAAIIKG